MAKLKRAKDGWQPMATAPKDGSTVYIKISGGPRGAFWCRDLKTWVLCNPIHIESVRDPAGWWKPGTPTPV